MQPIHRLILESHSAMLLTVLFIQDTMKGISSLMRSLGSIVFLYILFPLISPLPESEPETC